MSLRRPVLVLGLLALVAALLAGCGKSSSSSGGSHETKLGKGVVAIFGATQITQAQLDQALENAKNQNKASGQPFPSAGSPEYKQIQDRAVELLAQRAQLDEKAKQQGIVITDKQVEERLDQVKKQYFGGSDARYKAQLKKQGLTDEQVRDDLRGTLVSEALLKKAESNIRVTDAEVEAYYDQHHAQYSTPQTRVVRHILVKSKTRAETLYRQLKNGSDFAALAKKFSQDPGTKSLGGKLTITRGQTVPPFDSAAFALRTGQISKPVHTSYGWHIIKAVAPATPRQVTPLSKLRTRIRQLLFAQKRNQAATTWVNRLRKEFCSDKLQFATGFKPDVDPCAKTSGK
jgi:parvulin-like peptidyl-prolyl isomerase